MRKLIGILFIICLLLLTACGGNDISTEESGTDGETAQTDESVENETSDDEVTEADESTDPQEKDEDNKPSGAKAILEEVAVAMGEVRGMALEGEVKSKTEIAGIITNETSEISGVVTLDPYTQHLIGQTKSDMDGTMKMEMYTADQETYIFDPSSGWIVMSLGAEQMAATITDDHFENYSKHHELFDLSEDGENHFLSFEASGDIYKEIAYGGLRDVYGEEAYEDLISMFDDISGSYHFTVDKQTFRVVSLSYDTEMTMYGTVYSEDSGTYEYSKFNEVDEVTIPEDVIENAQSFLDM